MRLKERVEVDVGHGWVQRPLKPLMIPTTSTRELVRPMDRPGNGRVEGGVSPPAVRMPIRFMDFLE